MLIQNSRTTKKIANLKSSALEPQFPFEQLVDKIYKEDVMRTHIERRKIKTNSTL